MTECCRLCGSSHTSLCATVKGRELMLCEQCRLVFATHNSILAPEAEKQRYEMHENTIEDARYVSFLRQLADPVEEMTSSGGYILDYGSGPEPVLAKVFEQDGYSVDTYDPFFAHQAPQRNGYDAVTCSEVVEHFVHPREEFSRLVKYLLPGGVLGIMTLRYSDDTDFVTWHYAHDPTHIAFYCNDTFKWIESEFGLKRVYDDEKRVLCFEKTP